MRTRPTAQPLRFSEQVRVPFGTHHNVFDSYFSEREHAGAEALCRNNAVKKFRFEYGKTGIAITGEITLLNGTSYTGLITLNKNRTEITDTKCQCQSGFRCAHLAALALYYQKQNALKENKEETESLPELFQTSELPNLLARLRKDRLTDNETVSITYILSKSLTGRLSIQIELCDLDFDFNTKSRAISCEELAAIANRYRLRDHGVIAKLFGTAVSQASSLNYFLPPDTVLADIILEKILATGRAVWFSLPDEILAPGISLPAKLNWLVHNDLLRLVPVVDKEASEIVTFLDFALWYVDADNGTMGQLAFINSPSTDSLQSIFNLPPLEPEDFDEMQLYLKTNDQESLLPPLPSSANDIAQLLSPRVVLKLKMQKRVDTRTGALEDCAMVVAKLTEIPGLNMVTKRLRVARVVESLGFAQAKGNNFENESNTLFFEAHEIASWKNLKLHVNWLTQLGWNIDLGKQFIGEIQDVSECPWSLDIQENGSSWFSFKLDIEIDGKTYPLFPIIQTAIRNLPNVDLLAEIETLNKNGNFFARLSDGRPISLPFARIREIVITLVGLFQKRTLSERIDLTFAQARTLLQLSEFAKLIDSCKGSAVSLFKSLDCEPTLLAAPNSLNTTLRDYQLAGFSWLQMLRTNHIGGILADDMGLGKTVQALAHIVCEKENGRLNAPFLIVCPVSLVPNWLAEAKKLAPSLKVTAYQGPQRRRELAKLGEFDVVLTTYQLVLRDIEDLLKTKFFGIILDEAQAIKNASSKVRQMLSRLDCSHKISLTGTPIENHLGELWSHFDFLLPGFLGSQGQFNRQFRRPIEKMRDLEKHCQLAALVKPFILRRMKSEVASELPDKTVIHHEVVLTETQRDLYETVRVSVQKELQAEIATNGFNKSHISILAALMKLRQVCCDPRLLKGGEQRDIYSSAKLSALMDLVAPLVADDRRILIFSQFTSMLDLIAQELRENDIEFVELRGDTKDRGTPVYRFQNGHVPVFLISLKAGGSGLNLTAADTVIHYDPWWNPATEDQATDRAHRIGQDKAVFVYKLIAKGTVEEAMVELQDKKRTLTTSFLDNANLPALTADELQELLEPLKI